MEEVTRRHMTCERALIISHARLLKLLTASMFHVKEAAELGDDRAADLLRKCQRAHAFAAELPKPSLSRREWREIAGKWWEGTTRAWRRQHC